ncbi:MAG TPA: enoyl-CoA hydratase [Dehalococcoidia bacterium]|nr:enoyl-CoA hydratase [Dehalococcoidia bacterium]
MSGDLILVEKQGNICTLTINRPEKRNSVNPETLLQLGDTLNSLKEDGETRVIIIRGSGESAFSSGYDIGRLGGGTSEPEGPRRDAFKYCLDSIQDFPYPVIAMIYGYAVGGGLEIAVTCDIRLAADTARLGITPARLGVVYSAAGVNRFLNLVGISHTKELFYTGRIIDAERALDIGLVDHVYPVEELHRAAYELAQEIAHNAPLTIRGIKTTVSKLLKRTAPGPEDEAELARLQAEAYRSDDLKEGQKAFLEKRKPRFTGH